jgi:RNA polymerase sigma factor (sigma-70 family)
MAAIDVLPPSLPPSLLGSLPDRELAELVAGGSDDAFAALDERYRRRLVRFAQRFVPGGIADAEDAVQEAMVRAVRALRAGSRPEAVGPWLHRIARNCALDVSAARRRHPVSELADHQHPIAEDAQETVARSLHMRRLVTDVGLLPETQRSALVLRELEGRSYADIADELDVTVPAVKSLLVRARAGLKRAREERRAAAWLPVPALLGRLADRVATIWEPVSATAAPKVACVAVVLAGSVPVVAPSVNPVAPHHAAKTPKPTAAKVSAAKPPAVKPPAVKPPATKATHDVTGRASTAIKPPCDDLAREYGGCP